MAANIYYLKYVTVRTKKTTPYKYVEKMNKDIIHKFSISPRNLKNELLLMYTQCVLRYSIKCTILYHIFTFYISVLTYCHISHQDFSYYYERNYTLKKKHLLQTKFTVLYTLHGIKSKLTECPTKLDNGWNTD